MSPAIAREILNLFLRIFSVEWLEGYKAFCNIGLSDKESVGSMEEQIAMLDETQKGFDGKPLVNACIIDPFSDAKSFFKVYWEVFKFECTKHRLILSKKEALKLVRDSIPNEEVWQDIVSDDTDYDLFERMKRHDQEDLGIETAKAAHEDGKVAFLERKQSVGRILERYLRRSKLKDLPLDRLKVCFHDEIQASVNGMAAEGVYSSPGEIRELVSVLCPNIPKNFYPEVLNPYVERFKDMRDNPQPKLKASIYRPEMKVQMVSIPKVEIDHATGSVNVGTMEFQFNAKGIVETINALKGMSELTPQEFGSEVKNFLDKVLERCQKKNIHGFQNIVAKLQRKYSDLWAKSNKKSDDELKIGMIFTAFGLLNVRLSEDHIDPQKRHDERLRK